MTKYINKVTGTEMDYDKVHEDFECSLVWNGDCDPEEFLIEAYENEFEGWLLDKGIEEIEVPDPVKPKKKATKRKTNAKNKSNRVTTVCDNTIPSFIRMYQEWSAGSFDGKEFARIGLEVSMSLEKNPHLIDEIIALFGEEECSYFEEMYDAPTLEEKRFAFAEDLVMTEGFKAAHQCR